MRLLLLLLKPSLFSAIITIIATLLAIGVTNWSYFTYTPQLYPLLYGDFGVVTALEQSPLLTQGIESAVVSSPILYGAVVIAIAGVVGWSAFAFVRTIKNDIASIKSMSDSYQRKDILHHVVMRLAILVVWVLYSFVSITIIFPFCLLLSRIGAESITSTSGILMNIGAFSLFAIALHLHVIFLRLVLLRPRVFGAKATIESVAFYKGH